MLTVKLSQGTETQYNIPDDITVYINDFSDNARDNLKVVPCGTRCLNRYLPDNKSLIKRK